MSKIDEKFRLKADDIKENLIFTLVIILNLGDDIDYHFGDPQWQRNLPLPCPNLRKRANT